MAKFKNFAAVSVISTGVLLVVAFVFSNTALAQPGGLIPCGEPGPPCTLCHILVIIQKIINFFVGPTGIVYALAILLIAYGGFRYLIAGGSEAKLTQAKEIITAAVVGLLIGLGSYLIVGTIINVLGGSYQPAGFPWPWNKIDCSTVAGGEMAAGTLPTISEEGVTGIPLACVQPAGSPACPGTVPVSIPVASTAHGVNPYAKPALATALANAHSTSPVGFSLSEGCPPTVSHISSCHCNGGCVDINVSNPTAANIEKVCLALRAAGFSSSNIVNEYSVCTGSCAVACGGGPTTYVTTTGGNLHLNSPSGVVGPGPLACVIDSIYFLPSGTQADGWFKDNSKPTVQIVVSGSPQCGGKDFRVTLRQQVGLVTDVLAAKKVSWETGKNGFTINLKAGEEKCSVIYKPDCQYNIVVVDPEGVIHYSEGTPRGKLNYDCDGFCDEDWEILSINPN